MVKLVDTLASGASARKGVEVQVLSWAPLIVNYSSYLSYCYGAVYVRVITKLTTNVREDLPTHVCKGGKNALQ